ncbi:lipid II flippase family protein [Clostridium sp. YIM B02551]|uniref:lipid II flippase family protein n=1 Tax=Clostridium sp. YIM B02551 TaxID=2910679 RepID=UPI001EEA39A4|nr:DUF2837 family protein [Clostridium sp. YIM B02551]
MDIRVIIVLVMNFIITLIGTLGYSVRLVGVRTGKIAISFALFNIVMLVSRIAVSIQTPVLTSYVEFSTNSFEVLKVFYIIIVISTIATIVGAFLIPTFQKILAKGVIAFSADKSVSKIVLHGFSKAGVRHIKNSIAIPVKESVTSIEFKKLPKKLLLTNAIIVAISTAGALSPIYAGMLAPSYGRTCLALAGIINGIATLLLTMFTDPHLSIMTDDVIDGRKSPEEFRTCVIGMVGSKAIGTLMSVTLLVPAAYIIVFVAGIIKG